IEELEFTSGRHVHAYLATHGSLRDVIEAAYAAEAAGESGYRGLLTASLDTAPGERVAFSAELKPTATMMQLDAGDSVLPPAGAPGAQKARLLVVDDSDDIRRLLARVFRERDYEVIESATGLDALQKVRECAPDLLVLDAMLPGVHGFDVCRRLKGSRRYGHIPIVMLSAVYRGWRFAEDLRRSYGVDAFMEKPFRIGEVVAAVERALAGGGQSVPPEETELGGAAGEQLKAGIDAYARGEVDQAIDHLKRGISIDPLAFRLHYHLGLLYGKQENVFEAITELETAADLKPRDFSTLKNLAVLYQRAGFRLKAAELWERALGNAPDDATRSSIRNHLVSLL
ncbi:MAG: Phosphate regulon transcriptional regulatory protein PhoB, partial [Myxococcaceae bacterium]|nr:Phosphate regulon transcriptional regulatory protein PhoB [Myxococcaceae bacterium]